MDTQGDKGYVKETLKIMPQSIEDNECKLSSAASIHEKSKLNSSTHIQLHLCFVCVHRFQ